MTVRDVMAAGIQTLTRAGIPAAEAAVDAAVLARHVLGWSLTDWAMRLRDPAPAELAPGLDAALARRAKREPVAYITGVKEFYGRAFRVSRAVLIPRPETELLAEAALDAVKGHNRPLIVDVGTGSGCIAVTIALERPDAVVVGTDVSAEAIAVALDNSEQLGAPQVRFALLGDDEFVPAHAPLLDLIVSNPPYVPERDRTSLAADVARFEPSRALFGGDDGLDVIRHLVPVAASRLKAGGWLLMEVGAGQAADVEGLMAASGLRPETARADLQGIPRVVRARRVSEAPASGATD